MQRVSEFFEKHRDAAILAGLSCFLAGVTVAWLRLDSQPPHWDDARYLASSLVMFDTLMSGGLIAYVEKFFTVLGPKPPLITVLPTPAYLILGRDYRYAFIVNLGLMPVLFLAVYRIAKKYWNSRTGLIAAYVVATMPLIYGLARWYMVEFSLTALVCLTMYLLIRSEGLTDRRSALALGILCGLGSLLKVSFLLYVAFPILYTVIRFLLRARGRALPGENWATPAVKALLVFLLPAGLLPLPWVLINFHRAVGYVVLAGFSPEADLYGTGNPFSFGAVNAYLVRLTNIGPSSYYVGLAVLLALLTLSSGGAHTFFRAFSREAGVTLSLWALPFLVFLFGRNKDVRYVTPLLPIFALGLAFGIDFAASRMGRWRHAFVFLLLAFPLVALLQNSFGLFRSWRLSVHAFALAAPQPSYARMYDRNPWPHRKIVETLVDFARVKRGEKAGIVLGTDLGAFNSDNLGLAAVQARLPLEFVAIAYERDVEEALRLVNSMPFFIFEDGGELGSTFFNRYRSAALKEVQQDGNFVEIPYGLALPDGGRVRIYENLSRHSYLLGGAFLRPGLKPVDSCEVDFDGKIHLNGLAVTQKPGTLEVEYRWQCLKPVEREYWCFTHILDERGNVFGYLDHKILDGDPPMIWWREGDVAFERLRYKFRPPQPATARFLRLGLYDLNSGDRLRIRGASSAEGMSFRLTDGDTAVVVDLATVVGQAAPEKAPASAK
jgi:4-amino-4-deoxy-L-arabinose transferase-like glycosyltransferase